MNNSNKDDDETSVDEDDSFNDEMDSRVDVWKPPDATVIALSLTDSLSLKSELYRCVTDASGRFKLNELPE